VASNTKKYLGNYVGIVIQNNDPEKSGKVKVFIPHITATVYKKWVEEKTDKMFSFLGANIQSVLTNTSSLDASQKQQMNVILDELKQILPWAHCAAPIVGESTSGRFNNYNNFASISDSNFYSTFSQTTTAVEEMAGKPGSLYEKAKYKLNDAFTNAGDNINRPNPLAYEYVPSTYSNRAKGSFGIPAVGSHVWVFFREGFPTMPVYFAAVFGTDDWKGIYDSYNNGGIDYPGTFENKSNTQTEYNNNVETYRNKYVLNQKGGSIEITNTDLKENLKFTHYSGSFKEFNNQANIELATNNDQKLVLNDQYETVRGFKNEYVGKSFDENILRDKYKKIGTLNSDAFKNWKDIVAPIQDIKQLFEIQRALPDNINDLLGNIVIKRNSNQQTRVGTFIRHPALASTNIYPIVTDTADLAQSVIDDLKLYQVANSFTDAPELLDIPGLPALPSTVFTSEGVDVLRYTKDSGVVWGVGGVGFSTSSQDGIWAIDPRKETLKVLIESNMQSLVDAENELGLGGSEIINITKHKIETIGVEINNFGSIRYDAIGKMLTNEVLIDLNGTFVNYKESPLVEYVHVQDLPGGDYTLNVCNRFNVMVGAGGLNLKSLGSTNITGTITNIVGEQLNLASENEVNIDGKTINISAEILRLRNKNGRQIYIDDNLGINKNVIIGGGTSVEGELYVQHITAPTEYQVTELTKVFAKLLAGLQFKATILLPGVAPASKSTITTSTEATVTLTSDSNDDRVECYDHSHVFKNLPLTLHTSNALVREAATILNGTARAPAQARYHKKK